ncbi:MAG: 50S ribosomal protein L10 [Sulfolobales archaeon]|nr:50S ribosomal protein L10 [Sulfolobales archaeon]MDW7968934.1 50S ribosomal protein L10 [Sulfolobales archaeon]
MKPKTHSQYLKLLNRLQKSKSSEIRESKSRVEKELLVKELCDLIPKYRTICLIDLSRTPSSQFKELKKTFSKYGVIKVVKNNLLVKALEGLKLKNYEEVVKNLRGPNAVFLTNLNAFEVASLCRKFKSKRFAKPNDEASSEIVIPSGPTGIPPGPSLSMFGKLKIPTQVREGFIWIAKDVTVAKPGDKLSNELASLLRKLGIKVIDVGMNIRMIYDEGLTFTRMDELALDLGSFRNDLLNSARSAINLAINAAIPLPEVMPVILSKAYLNALTVSAESGILTNETTQYTLSRAVSKALKLASIISSKVPDLGIPTVAQEVCAESSQASKQPQESKEASGSEEEKKEVSEEELSEGLSSLFG